MEKKSRDKYRQRMERQIRIGESRPLRFLPLVLKSERALAVRVAFVMQKFCETRANVKFPVPQSSLMLHKRRSKPLSTTNKVVNKSFPKL